MARKIDSRIKVKGTLVTESPIHVGGINDYPEVDLALAMNGQGQYYIPGTSFAGVFRNWMQISGNENIDYLWGFQKENGDGHASYVIVEDAPILRVVVEIRDGVGIDRFWGTAAQQIKYDRAIIPRGSKIPLDMTLEIASNSQDWTNYKARFAHLIRALENGEIRLGAAKTRGLGRVKLQNTSIREYNLCSRNGMLQALLGGDDVKITLDSILNGNQTLYQNPRLTFEINWEPQSPLMVKAEGDGLAVDILPLVSAVDNSLTFVLPGSSIKGALRTQAERIVRTVLSLPTREEQDPKKRFIEQLEVPLVRDLFGATANTDKTDNKTQLGKIGSLFVDDCYANLPISAAAWRNIQAATNDQNLREALNDAKLQNTQQAFHVAVDRWTGGAADGFLYSNLEPMGVTWQPIRFTFTLNRLKQHQVPGISLLLLVLRDLAEGRIPLGYGTNRGMGSIKVKSVVIHGFNLDDSLAALATTLPNGSLSELNRELLDKLNSAWMEWINGQVQEGV
ncbi:RAMP superfamily CRISPR-associated protein [Scytonema sp. PRP1]|uniref:RAMP superfamily CRISPR-associated protein n=1 Tax=Scytonema sp. PRP1 TaxID=3120513 RepID=UPI002FD404B0